MILKKLINSTDNSVLTNNGIKIGIENLLLLAPICTKSPDFEPIKPISEV